MPKDCCESIKVLADAADAWRMEQKFKKALKKIEKALKIVPNFYIAWVMRGAIYGAMAVLEKGEKREKYLEEALRSLEKASSIKPKEYWPWFIRGKTFYETGAYHEALKAFDKALELVGEVDPAEIVLWQAKARFMIGDVEGCVRDVARMLKPIGFQWLLEKIRTKAIDAGVNVDKVLGLCAKALAEWLLAEGEDALKTVTEAMEMFDCLEIMVIKGLALSMARKYDEAIKIFQEVLAEDPRNVIALYGMGFTYRRLGKPKVALSYLEKALDIEPENPFLNDFRCDLVKKIAEDKKIAEECYRRFVEKCVARGEKNRFCAMSCLSLAMLLKNLGRYEEAEKYYKLAIELAPYPDSDIFFSYADLLEERLGRKDEALKYYCLAVKYATEAETFSSCGSVFEKTYGLYKEALMCIFKAFEAPPSNFMASNFMRHIDKEFLKKLIKVLRKRGEDCCDVVEMII